MLILHGDHTVASRQALLDVKTDGLRHNLNILEYSGSALTLSQLSIAAESASLLGHTNLTVVLDLFARRPGKEKTLLTDYLKSHPDAPVIIWEGKDITPQLMGFPPTVIQKYDLPKFIFKFLDNFSLDLYRQTLSHTSPEQIFALLSRQMRNLILAKQHITSGPDWQSRRLVSQSSRYQLSELLQLYQKLLYLDFAQKTSSPPYDLSTALELWVIQALR